MTLRDNASAIKRRAHQLLDEVRAGIPHPPEAVAWALVILGEPVEAFRTQRAWVGGCE